MTSIARPIRVKPNRSGGFASFCIGWGHGAVCGGSEAGLGFGVHGRPMVMSASEFRIALRQGLLPCRWPRKWHGGVVGKAGTSHLSRRRHSRHCKQSLQLGHAEDPKCTMQKIHFLSADKSSTMTSHLCWFAGFGGTGLRLGFLVLCLTLMGC